MVAKGKWDSIKNINRITVEFKLIKNPIQKVGAIHINRITVEFKYV